MSYVKKIEAVKTMFVILDLLQLPSIESLMLKILVVKI
jgi:hypothetical protein